MVTSARAATRIAVIGDVGGHLGELEQELRRLGADPLSGRLPDGLVVVQVGDLIHRGPDSGGVVGLVDHYLRTQPAQWVQLVGNHEGQYLRPPAFEWPEKVDGGAADTLRRWWETGQMVAAASISPGSPGSLGERFLVTHAGLTREYWRRVLGAIDDPAPAAAALNSFIGTHDDVLFNAGQMLGGGKPDMLAGPIWATAATELVPSWLGESLPFSQLHGHTTVARHPQPTGRSVRSGRRTSVIDEVLRRTTIDEPAGHETTTLDGGRIIGVDPGHTRRAQSSWRAWVFEGRGVVHT